MQAIKTTYHGPTNSRGSRIVAACDAKRITVAWDYALAPEANHIAAAEELRRRLDWNLEFYGPIATGQTVDGSYVHVMLGRAFVPTPTPIVVDGGPAIVDAPFRCPVDASHARFYARFQESVCAFIEPNGDRGEDLSNTYEGEGQASVTWCYDCSRAGVTTEAEAS